MKQFVGIFGRMFKVFIATALLVPALAAGVAAAGTHRLHYTIKDLGTLGGLESYGYGINNRGQVTGEASTAGGAVHAFIYGRRGGMQDLGTLGGSDSGGYGINNSGQVTGYSYISGEAAPHAFLFSRWTGMVDLGTVGGNFSWGNSINDFGQVTGEYYDGFDSSYHAFLFSASTGTEDLGIIGTDFSQGQGINDSGQVAGVYYDDNAGLAANYHAFIDSPGTVMKDLGSLGAPGYSWSYGLAINNFGQVTGWSSTATTGTPGLSNSAPVHAFLYDAWTGMEDLGTLGGTNSYGYSINIRGHVTGYSDIPGDSGQHAFLYRDGKMIDLNTLLPRSSKWTLLSGYGINDRGQITGYGLIKGQTHAFLMTPVRYR